MKKTFKYLLSLGLSMLVCLPAICSAGLLNPELVSETGNQAGIFTNYVFDPSTDDTTLTQYIANVLAVFFGLLATIFVVLIVIAGYNWMTAGGDAGKISKAQTIIKNATIGLVVLVSAYAITYWIFARLPDSRQGI